MDGELVPADAAKVPLLSHALHYGTAVFEGVRVYETAGGPAFFRLGDHIDRLLHSAASYSIEVPYGKAELERAAAEVVHASGLKECYLRPIVFPAEGTMSVSPQGARTCVAMAAWEWGPYLGDAGKQEGIRAKVSSWIRLPGDAVVSTAKAAGHYVNAALAKLETHRAGYEEGIMLDSRGMVSEGTGENIFLLADGVLVTPSVISSILEGITRRTVIELARDLGIAVTERDVARQELYSAREVFVTGTAAELTPIREIDDHPVGDGRPGPVTSRLQTRLDEVLRGRLPEYRRWNQLVGELC